MFQHTHTHTKSNRSSGLWGILGTGFWSLDPVCYHSVLLYFCILLPQQSSQVRCCIFGLGHPALSHLPKYQLQPGLCVSIEGSGLICHSLACLSYWMQHLLALTGSTAPPVADSCSVPGIQELGATLLVSCCKQDHFYMLRWQDGDGSRYGVQRSKVWHAAVLSVASGVAAGWWVWSGGPLKG
jgi:hypothetical protein